MHIVASNLELRGTQTLSHEHSRIATGGQAFAALIEGMLAVLPPPTVAERAPATAPPGVPTQDEVMRWALQTLLDALFGRTAPCNRVPLATETVAGLPERTPSPLSRRDTAPRLVLERWREEEQCEFAASGSVCLADGSERQFSVAWAHERRAEGARLTVEAGLRDPLVVDLAPPQAQLGEARAQLDLDGDGRLDRFRLPTAGSALLVHDRNGNGIADDGSELFGPRSGNGFAELARLDQDGNGWIDERDVSFAELKLWSAHSEGGSSVVTLAEAGIGALATRAVATNFTLGHGDGVVGQVRASSVWLGEHGGAGSVRQIDVAVEADETKRP